MVQLRDADPTVRRQRLILALLAGNLVVLAAVLVVLGALLLKRPPVAAAPPPVAAVPTPPEALAVAAPPAAIEPAPPPSGAAAAAAAPSPAPAADIVQPVLGSDSASDGSAAVPEQASEPDLTAFTPIARSPHVPRSPIPEVGETVERALPARRLAAPPPRVNRPPASRPAITGPVVRWEEAGDHVGKAVVVEGVVRTTHSTGEVCFLNFASERGAGFYAVLFQQVLGAWPEPPERYFRDQRIRVAGEVFVHNGRPQIRVREADQITLTDPAPPRVRLGG